MARTSLSLWCPCVDFAPIFASTIGVATHEAVASHASTNETSTPDSESFGVPDSAPAVELHSTYVLEIPSYNKRVAQCM
jgi:hypothetical protein